MFTKYLLYFIVKVAIHYSDFKQTDFALPQGSCLGSIFFMIYRSTLGVMVEDHTINLLELAGATGKIAEQYIK